MDGIYGPQTVDAVTQLQNDSGLPTTGLVDQATALALDEKLAAISAEAATQALTKTSALQTVLTLTGYWTGPVDGKWTPELTDALEQFQTALGVPPSGSVDAATLAAFEQALAELQERGDHHHDRGPARDNGTDRHDRHLRGRHHLKCQRARSHVWPVADRVSRRSISWPMIWQSVAGWSYRHSRAPSR